jgi:hypothetical protein
MIEFGASKRCRAAVDPEVRAWADVSKFIRPVFESRSGQRTACRQQGPDPDQLA